jgi:antitoxin CptB
MKELDLLLERFLRERYAAASGADRAAFAEFLELPDPELASYLLAGAIPSESRFAHIANLILSRASP